MGAGISTFFLLPKGTKLLAKLASALVADGWLEKLLDANGEDRGTWCDVVRRLLRKILVIPSDNEPCGDGGPLMVEYSCGGDIDDKSCSVRAVVATAFTEVGEAETDASGGSRTAENLEDEEPRDAREPGRSGDGMYGA